MKSIDTKKLTLTAVLLALVLLLGMTPIGLIPLGFINVTVLCIPVVVGASLVPQSALAGALVARSPLLAVVMCLVPRMLVPVAAHLVYRAASRNRQSVAAVLPAAVAASLTNTVFYLGLMLLFYALCGLDAAAVTAVIGGTGLIAGGAEAVVAALVCTPVLAALFRLDNHRKDSSNT